MQLRIFTEPQQGADYGRLLAVAKASEELGFDGFFRSDHYLRIGEGSGLPGPTDAWITLAGLAVQTSRIRLGTLVSPVTFRYPGPLAIAVAQADSMSSGRIELGLGTGWFADEHTAYGVPFPPLAERFGMLAEQLAIITGLWQAPGGETFSYQGSHYTITGSPALPKPVQRPRPPIIIGGAGRRRTPELAVSTRTSTTCRLAASVRHRKRSAGWRMRVQQPAGTGLPCATRQPRWSAAARQRRNWPAGQRLSAGTLMICAPAAWPAALARSWTSSGASPKPGPAGSTCRYSTSMTLGTWNCSPAR
jgi:F420-dependent oxidoreductase-like protein